MMKKVVIDMNCNFKKLAISSIVYINMGCTIMVTFLRIMGYTVFLTFSSRSIFPVLQHSVLHFAVKQMQVDFLKEF